MSGALLEVRDLCVEVADRVVLDRVSFRIAPGEIVGLRGNSGAGKTTLALALSNLLSTPPYRVGGEVRFADGVSTRVGYIFQDPLLALNPVLRVRTQITEILRAHGVRRDPAELLSLAGLAEPDRILRAYPHQLSGGERQRVTIAQALASDPQLIVADEPFTALDAPRIVALAQLFLELRDRLRMSFLVISHAPGVLRMVADRVIVLEARR